MLRKLKFNDDKYEADIKIIKNEYENKIREKTMEYEKDMQKINNKYKLINEEINIISENNIEKIQEKHTNIIKKYDFNNKIENITNINRLNKIIYNL